MAKQKAFLIHWKEWEQIPEGFGHGVEFHTDSSPRKETLIAFLDGYDWLHGKPKSVPICIRKADLQYSPRFLRKVKTRIEIALKSGTLKDGYLGEHLYAWFNA